MWRFTKRLEHYSSMKGPFGNGGHLQHRSRFSSYADCNNHRLLCMSNLSLSFAMDTVLPNIFVNLCQYGHSPDPLFSLMTLDTAYINELTTPVMPYDLTNCDPRISLTFVQFGFGFEFEFKANDPSLAVNVLCNCRSAIGREHFWCSEWTYC